MNLDHKTTFLTLQAGRQHAGQVKRQAMTRTTPLPTGERAAKQEMQIADAVAAAAQADFSGRLLRQT